MAQVSRPMQIALLATVLFAVVWFVMLRPGGGDSAPVPAPTPKPAAQSTPSATNAVKAGNPERAQSGPGRAAARAQAGVDRANGANGAGAGSTSAVPAVPRNATPAVTRPARPQPAVAAPHAAKAQPKGLPANVQRALDRHKVLVLLFWTEGASDDRAVFDAVRSLDRREGKVVVADASIGELARYAPITRDLGITQSPSVVVVDPARRATVLAGFTTRRVLHRTVASAAGAPVAR